MSGFIALHRSLLDWEWYSEPNTCRVFIHCMLKANWKDKSHRGKLVKRGHFLTSLDDIAKETGLSVRNVRTAFKNLKMTNELTIITSTQGTEIKVNNYDYYQPLTDEVTNETTSARQAPDKQVTTTNKDNKDNKEINKPKKSATKTQLPRDFCLPEEWKTLALNYWLLKNRNDLTTEEEFFKFKNHHLSQNTRSADWKSSWSTWYANAVKFNKPAQQQMPASSPVTKQTMPKAGTVQ